MRAHFWRVFLTVMLLVPTWSLRGETRAGETRVVSDQRFQNLFITAGYATAFGAALGLACLGLTREPRQNLRYVAIGASLGFISGSVLGVYTVFAPTYLPNAPASPIAPSYGAREIESSQQVVSSTIPARTTLSFSPVWTGDRVSAAQVSLSFPL